MSVLKPLTRWFTHFARESVDFFASSYHPERYYMRGPGPACMRKTTDRLPG